MSFDLILEQHDVWLFRDGRPFTAGEDIRARSLFPPTPFTIQGAIRARVLFSSPVSPADYAGPNPSPAAQDLRRRIGAPGQGYGQLRLQGPLLARRENNVWKLFFPLPADVVKVPGGGYAVLSPLKSDALHVQSNMPDGLWSLWIRNIKRVEEARGWVSEEDFRRYRQGQAPEKVYKESDFVVREHRFGIALDQGKRTARAAHLYLAEFVRLKDGVALWVRVDGIQLPDLGSERGVLQLGGEARAAHYSVHEARALDWMPSREKALPERFKVVLLTPAWFAEGWRPTGGDWSRFFTGKVRLVSAAVPRYQPIGGAYVDDQRRKDAFQKPMRRFVPAGAVYFFEAKDPVVQWAGQPFTETPPDEGDFGQIGFGLLAVGEWDYT